MARAVNATRAFPTMQQRNAWIVEQVIDKDRTLTDVARDLGITRERVRQIVDEAFGEDGVASMVRRKRAQKREAAVDRAAHRNRLEAKFSIGGKGRRGDHLAAEALANRLSDEEMFVILRREVRARPEISPFGPFLWDRTIVYPDGPGSSTGIPTAATYIKRFGSFHEALLRAGLPAYHPKGEQAHRRSDESLVRDVMRFLADPNNRCGGAEAYQTWARTSVPKAASLSLIRSRGVTWQEIKTQALEGLGLGTPEAVEAFIAAEMENYDLLHNSA